MDIAFHARVRLSDKLLVMVRVWFETTGPDSNSVLTGDLMLKVFEISDDRGTIIFSTPGGDYAI